MSIILTHVKGPETGSPNKQLHQSDISVPLPAVLGRGTLLKCAEKKVSRRHATLDWDDDGVIINSIHQSPTFVIVSGKKQKLSQGESAVLGHGDKFGLLDDAFWFRVTLENSKQSCDKENALISNTEAKLEKDIIKESKSMQENRNEVLNQNKQIIINNKFEDSKENKLNVKTSTVVKVETSPEYIKKNLSFPNSSFSSNDKLDASEQISGTSSKVTCKANQSASTSYQIANTSSSSHEAAKVSLTFYTAKDLDDAVNDRKRTLPSWMTRSASSINKATSNKNDSTHAVQHGRKNNKATQKKQNTSKLKDDSKIKNSDNVEEKSERKERIKKNTPKNTPSKSHDIGQNYEEIEEKIEKKKSPLKRSPKASHAKTTPSKYHGLSQEVDDEIIEEHDVEIKNCTTDNLLHNLSDDGSDNDIHSPQKILPSPRKYKTPDKKNFSSGSEDNAEFENNKTKNTVGSRLAGVTTITTNTSTGDAEGRGRKRAASRGSCQFGTQCYRKNPQHKVEYAHPEDSDYNEDEDEDEVGDDDDGRPECEFGVDCYRKNPQHRKQFKHTRFPQPIRKAKRKEKRKKRESDESESDEYDYDDPFLNDDSSDDYAPSDSGSDTNMEDNDDEEEDTKRMLKEGKKFVKKN